MSAVPTNDVQQARERLDRLRTEVSRIYIGSPKAVDMMLIALVAKGHVLLEGVPGVA
jgi:MoxR-like ATPase